MLPFKLVYSDNYYLPIGSHVFPAEKYKCIHDRLLASGVAVPTDFAVPRPAADEDVLLVHTPAYVHKLKTGTLTALEELELEVPYSPELVRAFWLAAGGSILAADHALEDGIAISIGGGFHHAFPDHGEGFCVINDVAVAIRCMQRDAKIRKAMTVDCDVHQGNGTAAIFSGAQVPYDPLPTASASVANPAQIPTRYPARPALHGTRPSPQATDVLTISLHQLNNYPSYKPPSSLDLNLPDGIGDADYLACLGDALSMGLEKFEPDLICYLAGADPYCEDQLGGLSLTIEGLKQRDALVFEIAKTRAIPVMVTYAGGYALKLEDTITIHCNTVVAAKEVYAGKDLTK